ncbi:type IV secretion system protein [Thermocatellispora tengchongensis]|uniref:type IV secretion system protein n=1 Tax=Thermocatellispora tengchongensis TaxID=1073253 RepID=UPI00363C17AF
MLFLGLLALPLALPTMGTATAAAPCDLSPDLAPEIVDGGLDGLLKPPADSLATTAGAQVGAQQQPTAPPAPESQTNYDRYGMAGQFWHTHQLGCDDVAAVLGNAWANTIFLWAKSVDRMTITTYQAAATEGPLQSIKDAVDGIVTNLANAMYWPYLRPVVILGAIWLAWYGLIRKRATTTAEGVIWMVLAVTVAVWFFSRPGDFTGIGKVVTDKTGEIVNSAFAGLPNSGGVSCLPTKGDTTAEAQPGGYGQAGTPGVDQNADALWSTLVCKPWLMGQFGTADPNAPVVRDFGAKVLDIQAIDAQEMAAGERPASDAYQKRYEEEFADKLENTAIFPLIQGKDWTTRLGIAIGALIAAMVAGLLIFLVAVSLLVLKVGFLLLLILAPVFLLIGVHPGSGRIIAMRWLEMLIGTLLRQAVLALVLGVLVYGYALIIATAMPWGLQILFMALLTIAVFFYRRPFQHLFASMDGHTLTTRMLGEAATAPTLSRAANALPPVAGYRAGRWGLRKAEPLLQTAAIAGGATAAAAAAGEWPRAGRAAPTARRRPRRPTPGCRWARPRRSTPTARRRAAARCPPAPRSSARARPRRSTCPARRPTAPYAACVRARRPTGPYAAPRPAPPGRPARPAAPAGSAGGPAAAGRAAARPRRAPAALAAPPPGPAGSPAARRGAAAACSAAVAVAACSAEAEAAVAVAGVTAGAAATAAACSAAATGRRGATAEAWRAAPTARAATGRPRRPRCGCPAGAATARTRRPRPSGCAPPIPTRTNED